MSESANGGEVDFVRLYLTEIRCYVGKCDAAGVNVELTPDAKEAEIFISPSLSLIRSLAGFFGGVHAQQATFEDWINHVKVAQ